MGLIPHTEFKIMTLNELEVGQTAKVVEIDEERLIALGVAPDSIVRLIKKQTPISGFMVRINETMTLIMDEVCAKKIVVNNI